MVYGYKNYLVNNTDLHYLASKYKLWLAEYPNYAVTREPNYNFFPSFENIGLFQYTSTAIAGGLDRNIDLTGITDNGYVNGNSQKPKTETPATEQGKQIHKDTHNRYGMEMNALAQLNGKTINDVIHPGQVIRVADKGDGQSVSNKVNTTPAQPSNNTQYYTVQPNDTLSGIATKFGTTYQSIAFLNRIDNPNWIYPGQRLKINRATQNNSSNRVHYVRYGETLSGLSYSLGVNYQTLLSKNNIANPNFIRVGQAIYY